MKNTQLFLLLCFIFILNTQLLHAQVMQNNYSTKGWWNGPNSPFSPIVNADNSITFRIKAKIANKVHIMFDGWDNPSKELSRDTAGIWSITINSVAPGVYEYFFFIDGVRCLDLANPKVKAGQALDASIVEVSGFQQRFDELQKIPHGTIYIIKYFSTPLNKMKDLVVFTPAEYETEASRKFPVLYLRHGGGDCETSWYKDGKADVILENLIAAKKAVPMIVVMSNGMTDGSWSGGSSPEGITTLENELISNIIPLVEKRFRVANGSQNRAIAGLSMGGGQAFVIALRNMDTFSWIGEFSAGILSDRDFQIDKYIPGILDNHNDVNNKIKLLWISCGSKDIRFPGYLNFIDMLMKKGINCEAHEMVAGHEWKFWRQQLAEFSQKLFQ
ncbi:MAG: alpha/beta hydrolase-fold protein [Paludibacter sp.]|nr:alpha/beta hydrolase-fold protein [Paludibacter sp.]